MKAALLILCCLAGCKAHFEEETRTHVAASDRIDAAQHVETHVQQAAGRITTTVEKFAPPQPQPEEVVPSVPTGQRSSSLQSKHGSIQVAGGAVPELEHGPLIERTVTVAETGAVTTDTHVDAKSQERADSVIDGEYKGESSFDFLHSPFALLGGLVALAGVAFAAFKILKPRLLP